jgi:hypothetical protein
MKRHLLAVIFLLTILFAQAQNYQWAKTVNTPSRPAAVAIRQDGLGNNYIATYSYNVGQITHSFIQKLNEQQQTLWQRAYTGLQLSDMEMKGNGNLMLIGSFIDSISISGFTFYSPSFESTFLFEVDTTGNFLWGKVINPTGTNFTPVDLFVASNGELFFTSLFSGSNGFTAFHKTDANGNLLHSEFNGNFENRTYSHIVVNNNGEIFVSGTCGNGAAFDNLSPASNSSYQHFLVKYDSVFNAQWLITRDYITFDNNNSLDFTNQYVYWAFDDFTGNQDTVKVLKVDFTGQIVNELTGPLASAFFNSPYLSVDDSGNCTLLYNIYQRLYWYRYDNSFNLLYKDSLMVGYASFDRGVNVMAYDSSFYVLAPFMSDTVTVGNVQIINGNATNNFPMDLLAFKWGYNFPVSVNNAIRHPLVKLYPNPASQIVYVETNNNDLTFFSIINNIGQIVSKGILSPKSLPQYISLDNWSPGIYTVTYYTDKGTNSSIRLEILGN